MLKMYFMLFATLLSCANNKELVGKFEIFCDPDTIQEDISLFDTEPILLFKFTASESGYALKTIVSRGNPTTDLYQNRDVQIKVLNAAGDSISTISVFNPREIRTAGTTEADSTVLKTATFAVSVSQSIGAHSIEVTVLRGPNSDFNKIFPIQLEQDY